MAPREHDHPATTLIPQHQVEGLQQQAIDFLAYEVPRTRSRLLMTSRTQLMGAGGITTKIHGLAGAEANAFIDSRITLFELDRNAFGPRRRERIQAVTKGSPLFLQDLMWLCRRTGVDEAIARWERDGGEAARDYALKREFEQLPPHAQEVLLAASLFAGPVSVVEIRRITGFSERDVDDAIAKLQSSYLLPTPKLVEAVDRFELNPNVRLVVRRALGSSDSFRRIERGAHAVQGTLSSSATEDREIRFFIHEALALADEGKFSAAEEALQVGLKRYENSPQLLGRLGWLYKNWPLHPRLADAREAFRRASDLGAREPLMYWNWLDLEQKQREWTEACRIVALARAACPTVVEFVQFEGYLRMGLGQELRRRFDQVAATAEFEKASRSYWDALKKKPSDDIAQRALRGIVRCSAEVNSLAQAQSAVREYVTRFGKDSPGVGELEALISRRWPS